jgi:hypothetical protein
MVDVQNLNCFCRNLVEDFVGISHKRNDPNAGSLLDLWRALRPIADASQ